MLKPAATRPPPDEKEQRPDAKFNHIERGGDRTHCHRFRARIAKRTLNEQLDSARPGTYH